MKLRKYLQGLVLKEEEKQKAGIVFSAQNLDRISVIALLALPVSLVHIFLFWNKLDEGSFIEQQWRHSIIWAHLIVSLVLLAFFTGIFINRKMETPPKSFPVFISHFSFILILGIGAVIANLDQLVTSAINPYLLVCIFIPIVIIIPPVYSALYFAASFVLFALLLPAFQTDSNIVLSNYVNGLSTMTLGLILSLYLWWFNVSRFRQETIIRLQKEQLVDQNTSLRDLSEELKLINASKDKFFSILAHDLRGPMNGFLGLTEIIATESHTLSDNQIKELADSMQTSAIHISRLLDNLLEWSKVQRGYVSFNPESFSLPETVHTCIQLFSVESKKKDIKIKTQLPDSLTLYADKHMVEIILRNLISNALKFTGKGGHVHISAVQNNSSVLLSVEDTGIGMSPEIAGSVFSETGSIKRKGTAGEPSTGLGLQLCKEFVDNHSGQIDVRSEEGKGSKFSIVFPQDYPLP